MPTATAPVAFVKFQKRLVLSSNGMLPEYILAVLLALDPYSRISTA